MTARVSAIVLNWCNAADTSACIESLVASRYDALTVLIVDNGSPDGSGDALHARFPDTPYLQTGSNTGYAGGNNAGMRWALDRGADFILILNDDTVIDADCIAVLVRAAEETGAAIVVPQVLYFDDPAVVWYGGGWFSPMRALGVHAHENQPVDMGHVRRPVTFVCGCCFLIRADVARESGGFDEAFFAYVEDAELSLRLTRAGHSLMYEPAARVLHRVTRGAPSSVFGIRQRDRNRRRLARKHYGWFDRIRFALWFFPTRLLLVARYAGARDWPRARAVCEGTLGALGP